MHFILPLPEKDTLYNINKAKLILRIILEYLIPIKYKIKKEKENIITTKNLDTLNIHLYIVILSKAS